MASWKTNVDLLHILWIYDKTLPPVDCHITSNGHRDEKHGSPLPNSNICAWKAYICCLTASVIMKMGTEESYCKMVYDGLYQHNKILPSLSAIYPALGW
jgi:hypothetical protein